VTTNRTKLFTLLGDYPCSLPIKQGKVSSDLVEFEFADIKVANTGFKPLVREAKFDLGELAIVTFLQAKAYNKPYVLMPAVVVARAQHHTIAYNSERGELKPADLAGKRVASPQLGNTQDIALRWWLRQHQLAEGSGAGAVRVFPLSNADILGLFARGELEAAWVPEPWGARLRARGGRVLVDERDLWPDRQFPTTLVIATQLALDRRRGDVVAVLRAHLALTGRWKANPAAFARSANAEYGRLTGHPLEDTVLLEG